MMTIGIGGALGALTRFLLSKWIGSKVKTFPLATGLINITGAFLLGYITMLHMNEELNKSLYLFLGSGFLGSYTTFSTFGFETIGFLEKKEYKKAAWYVGTTLIFGIPFAYLGMLLA
ncbi:fluoride efflux transporter CrcB [Bacillus sp. 165]|uniref:fluoride efflux transporter CrcB n=1 Tax=Bacillus sp. 165 TaxID=1529117 RepID=UPI001ADC73FC|nr:fluoride efflux transporter CrcB [Bacillus sp. 165]MBO9129780.1 fluoride efflux transporter CrcB [Bacillus sp. 165]